MSQLGKVVVAGEEDSDSSDEEFTPTSTWGTGTIRAGEDDDESEEEEEEEDEEEEEEFATKEIERPGASSKTTTKESSENESESDSDIPTPKWPTTASESISAAAAASPFSPVVRQYTFSKAEVKLKQHTVNLGRRVAFNYISPVEGVHNALMSYCHNLSASTTATNNIYSSFNNLSASLSFIAAQEITCGDMTSFFAPQHS
eukprot:TRINITY_DN17785_c0_g1_i1.p1 TRINITY_DN17785_c0_g1~~TRINITY_DN17785_c0_g1_i1.p1  ORF type:complete len:202 (+),score=54.20 TRINITY_DN17785_c0_g1_i1:54-659(+)